MKGVSLYIFMALALCALFVGLAFGLKFGDDITKDPRKPLFEKSDKLFTHNRDLAKVCIEGHTYYLFTPSGSELALAPKLDSIGKPCMCTPDEMEKR